MTKRRLFALAIAHLAGISALSHFSLVNAGSVVPYTLKQRSEKSTAIVVARVESISSNWDSAGREIYTFISLRIENKIKGNLSESIIELCQLGGRVGNTISSVSGVPQFIEGEKVLVFLGKMRSSKYYGVIDWLEGKKSIEVDQAGREFIQVGIEAKQKVYLEDYLGDIRTLVK